MSYRIPFLILFAYVVAFTLGASVLVHEASAEDVMTTPTVTITAMPVIQTLPTTCERGHAPTFKAPPLYCTTPDFVTIVKPGGMVHIPARAYGSDVQCYRVASQTAYSQRTSHAGPYWVSTHGRAVVGLETTNHDFISWAKVPVLCASWGD